MSAFDVVKRARGLLAHGWHPVLTLDHNGWICDPTAEEATRFAALDALMVSGSADDVFDAVELVCALAAPRGSGRTFFEWEGAPGRTARDVLALFDLALVRALALRRGISSC